MACESLSSRSGRTGRSAAQGHGLQSAAAERALVAAIAARPMLARPMIVDVGAELGIIAEQRLELGGDRRLIGAGKGGRREGGRRRDGEKLDEERERDDECGAAKTRGPATAA